MIVLPYPRTMPKATDRADAPPRVASRLALAIAGVVVYCVFAVVINGVYPERSLTRSIMVSHFPTVAGLPLAAARCRQDVEARSLPSRNRSGGLKLQSF
jgi:hypothetical protein